jgi:hypothetical protein
MVNVKRKRIESEKKIEIDQLLVFIYATDVFEKESVT